MMRHITGIVAGGVLAMAAGYANASVIFNENFNNISAGVTMSSPANNVTGTTLNMAWAGTATGSTISAVTTISSTIDDGSSARIQSDPGTGSNAYAYLGKTNVGTSLTTVVTMSFDFKALSMGGSLTFGMGAGNTITNATNNGLNGNHYMWRLTIDGTGALYYSNASDTNVQIAGVTISANQEYSILVQVNGESTAYNQGATSITAESLNVYINGVLVGSNLALRNGTATAQGFRITANASSNQVDYEIDNIKIWDEIASVPEPAGLGIAAVMAGGFLLRRRRA